MMKIKHLTRAALLATVAGLAATAGHAEITLRMATDSGAKGSGPGDTLEAWAKLIEEGSNGEISVDIFYQNELGGQQEMFDLLMAGDIDLALNWPLTSYEPRMSLLYTPYMFTTWEDAFAAMRPDGWLSDAIGTIYQDQGLTYLGAWPEGFNGIGTKGGAATTIADAAQFKVRVPPVTPFTETVAALGYQTATIDWGELYSAIQTGVVDGDAANVIFYDLNYFGDVLTDWTYTRQQFLSGIFTANNESFDELSEEHRQLIADSARELMEARFEVAQEADTADVEEWKAKGLNYITLSDEELAPMMESVREAVWPLMDGLIGADLMQLVRDNAK